MQYSVNYSHHAVHSILMTHLFCKLKFVPFDPLHPFCSPHPHVWQPPICSLYLWACLFLVSTYKWDHTVFVFPSLTYFIQQNALKVHPCCCKQQDFILFCSRIIFRCIFTPRFLYPFICRWTPRLFLCLDYCKWCCNEHGGAYSLSS